MNELDIFIMNLKNLMREYNLTKNELAKKMNMSYSNVANIINKNGKLTMNFAISVCDTFGVSMADMFTPDENQFDMKRNTSDENKDEIIKKLKSDCNDFKRQINKLQNDYDSLFEENKKLDRDLSALRFKEDSLDGKVRLITKNDNLVISKDNVDIPLFTNGSNLYIDYSYKDILVNVPIIVNEINIKESK